MTTALVSQTMYQDVRDGFAVYFFKEEAEAPVLELCESKDYVIDQNISLEMPETAYTWNFRVNPKFCVNSIGGANRAKFI